tara:strand:- start:6221 stop:6676 length:456 start_codon:yes stop_codon:yes gene_type:complete
LNSFSKEIVTNTPEETLGLGIKLAPFIGIGKIAYLKGPLGAGKTTLVKGITEFYKCSQPAKSPTFILVTSYFGDISINHCDFFRLNNSEEIFDLALEEYLEDGNLIIEWPEIGEKYLPKPDLEIILEHTDLSSQRKIIIKSNNKESLEKLL